MASKGQDLPPAYSEVRQQVPPVPPNYVIAAQPIAFNEHPIPMKCPFCHADIITGTEYKVGMFTWIVIGSICLIGAAFMGITWLGCCLIPCCINSCKDVTHTCPNCQRPVGTYDRLKSM